MCMLTAYRVRSAVKIIKLELATTFTRRLFARVYISTSTV